MSAAAGSVIARLWARLAAHPLAGAVVGALVLRLVAASGYGYFAADDYLYVIEPAARWLDDPGAPYPSHYRSELVPRAFSALLGLGRAVGLDDPAHALSFAYAALGLWSLVSVPAAYWLTRRRLGERAAVAAAWLCAAQPLMPRLATQALLGVIAMPPLVLGLLAFDAMLDASGRRRGFFGAAAGVAVGFAAMLRFQIGVLTPALFLVALLWPSPRRERWLGLAALSLGLALALVAQGVFDLGTKGGFLAAPLAYLAFNVEHSSDFGTSAWHSYLGFFLVLTLPPLTLWLWRPMWRAARAHPSVSAPLVLFVLAHSLVAHKEERFVFAVLPLFFVLLGAALVDLERTRAERAVRAGFVGVNALALVLVTLSAGQQSLIAPLLAIARGDDVSRVVYVSARTRVPPAYFTGGRAEVERARSAEELSAALSQGPRSTRLLFDEPPRYAELARIEGAGYRCDAPRLSHGDVVDRLLLAARPRQNRRRAPVVYLDCHPEPGLAGRN